MRKLRSYSKRIITIKPVIPTRQGIQGEQGIQGVQGETGATGAPGTTVHSALTDLDYASAGHTGFQPAGSYLTAETDPVFAASEAADFVAGDKAKLDGIAAGAEVNVNADWNAGSGDAQILNKPTLATMIHYSKSAGVTTTGANQTPVSVNGAVFNYVANAVYRIWVMGRINSTAATTGIGIQFDLSSAVTAIDVQFFHQLAAGTTGTLTGGHSIADDTSAGASSGVPAGPLDVPFSAFGLLVTGANAGTAQLRFRSEANAVTELLAGVVMVVERVA